MNETATTNSSLKSKVSFGWRQHTVMILSSGFLSSILLVVQVLRSAFTVITASLFEPYSLLGGWQYWICTVQKKAAVWASANLWNFEEGGGCGWGSVSEWSNSRTFRKMFQVTLSRNHPLVGSSVHCCCPLLPSDGSGTLLICFDQMYLKEFLWSDCFKFVSFWAYLNFVTILRDTILASLHFRSTFWQLRCIPKSRDAS